MSEEHERRRAYSRPNTETVPPMGSVSKPPQRHMCIYACIDIVRSVCFLDRIQETTPPRALAALHMCMHALVFAKVGLATTHGGLFMPACVSMLLAAGGTRLRPSATSRRPRCRRQQWRSAEACAAGVRDVNAISHKPCGADVGRRLQRSRDVGSHGCDSATAWTWRTVVWTCVGLRMDCVGLGAYGSFWFPHRTLSAPVALS